MKAFIEEMAKVSGNTLIYYPVPVITKEAAEARGEHTQILSEKDSSEIFLRQETLRYSVGRGIGILLDKALWRFYRMLI